MFQSSMSQTGLVLNIFINIRLYSIHSLIRIRDQSMLRTFPRQLHHRGTCRRARARLVRRLIGIINGRVEELHRLLCG